jgi:hypothetical protein
MTKPALMLGFCFSVASAVDAASKLALGAMKPRASPEPQSCNTTLMFSSEAYSSER